MERIRAAVDDRGAGVVAGGLDREDQHGLRLRTAVGGLEPHDQGVLAVVVVVAAAVPGAAEAEALVHRDRAVVRGPDLERVAGVRAGLLEQALEQPAARSPGGAARGVTATFIRCQTSA